KFTGGAFHCPRVKDGPLWNSQAAGEFSPPWIGLELGYRHRGNRAEVMRIEKIEQSFGNLWKIVIDAQMNPRRQESKGLQHSLHMGILTTVRFQEQARGNLGMLDGELRAHLPQEREFTLVVISQLIAQDRLP